MTIDTNAERAKLDALAGYTPGPWDGVGLTVYDTCLDGVASCHTGADARLVAAAPDLLTGYRAALDEIDRLREALEDIGVYGCGMLNQPAALNGPEEEWLEKRIRRYEQVARAALNGEETP